MTAPLTREKIEALLSEQATSQEIERVRRLAQRWADHWRRMLAAPEWLPERSHIEMAAGQFQHLAARSARALSDPQEPDHG